MTNRKTRVLVAGIGGASLGTEVLKCLMAAGCYDVFGCDISRLAFGHYGGGFVRTRTISRDHYVAEVLAFCRDEDVGFIIPGGEEPLALLSDAASQLSSAGVQLLANTPEVVATCSHKGELFERLDALGFAIPRTVRTIAELHRMSHPCIVKPATGSAAAASSSCRGRSTRPPCT